MLFCVLLLQRSVCKDNVTIANSNFLSRETRDFAFGKFEIFAQKPNLVVVDVLSPIKRRSVNGLGPLMMLDSNGNVACLIIGGSNIQVVIGYSARRIVQDRYA